MFTLLDITPQVSESTAQSSMQSLKTLSLDDLIDKLAHNIVDFAIHLAVAILVFYIGKFIIKRIYGIVASILLRRKADKSLSTFILSLIKITLYFILVVTVIGILGINTSSFIAIFASAGVAIGMALSGTLQNFAGGVLILLLKPYKVGDYIEAQGFAGTVTEIQIFSTIINTYDNKSIIIPNGGLSTGSINNWSRESYRRIDWTISLSYGADVEAARQVIIDMLLADERIVKSTIADDMKSSGITSAESDESCPPDDVDCKPIKRHWYQFLRHSKRKLAMAEPDPHTALQLTGSKLSADSSPKVYLSLMADSSIQLTARAWTQSSLYWPLFYHFNELFYTELPKHGFSFPFPQLDVHINQ